MEDTEHAFGTSIFILDHTVHRVSAEDAVRTFGDVTQENFWRMWPSIKEWADTVWSEIQEDRGRHSSPVGDDDDDHAELGGGG